MVRSNIWYSEEGTRHGCRTPKSLLAVPNVTAYPSTVSVPITELLYNVPLLCGFTVPNKGIRYQLTNNSKINLKTGYIKNL